MAKIQYVMQNVFLILFKAKQSKEEQGVKCDQSFNKQSRIFTRRLQ